jgi:hypothetical protein
MDSSFLFFSEALAFAFNVLLCSLVVDSFLSSSECLSYSRFLFDLVFVRDAVLSIVEPLLPLECASLLLYIK